MQRLKTYIILTIFCFNIIIPPQGYAQSVFNLPQPGEMIGLSEPVTPVLLKGVSLHPEDPLLIDFIVDNGTADLKEQTLTDETTRLVKYFLAGLAVPENELWVNLSPAEKNRIMADPLSHTDAGRDMLAQDYILKQVMSTLMYPENDLGRKFWDTIYNQVYAKFGHADIPVDTFNKVWITPDEAEVYQHDGNAFVTKAHLKVMLESDYVAMSQQKDMAESSAPAGGRAAQNAGVETQNFASLHHDATIQQGLAKQVIRNIILPVLEKEVNEGQNFAQLRQVYNSLILATWYKKKVMGAIKGSPLEFYVGQNKVAGVNSDDPKESEKIWARYVESFKRGAYNFIREEYDPATRETIPRKYFAGGVNLTNPIFDGAQLDTAGMTTGNAMLIQLQLGDIKPVDDDVLIEETADAAMMEGLMSPDKGLKFAKRMEGLLAQKDLIRKKVPEYGHLLNVSIGILAGYRHYKTRDGHINYLSQEGEQSLSLMQDFLEKTQEKGFVWDRSVFLEFQRIMTATPTVLHPETSLFVPVLENFTEEQLRLIANDMGYFMLSLTHGCSNQCVMCQSSKEKGPIFSIPFPLVAGVLLKMKQHAQEWSPWNKTEASDYYDEIMGASLGNILHYAGGLDLRTIMATNGTRTSMMTEKIIGKMKPFTNKQSLQVSFHTNYGPVVQYARDVYANNGADLAKTRQGLINLYVNKYKTLFKSLHQTGINFRVSRHVMPSESFMRILEKNNNNLTVAVLKEMYQVSDEVWAKVKVKGLLGNSYVSDIETDWLAGDGAVFLESTGVSLKTLAELKATRSPFNAISSFQIEMESNGEINVVGHNISTMLRLDTIIPDPNTPGFEMLIQYFRILRYGFSLGKESVDDHFMAQS